jgi:phenylacetate-CoA ligase
MMASTNPGRTLGDSLSVWLSRYLWHPLWDFKDGSVRLSTLRELEQSQWLPQEELKARQWARLQETLAYAYDACAYYRQSFERHGIRPTDIKGSEDLSRVPILTKKEIQQHQDALISRHYNKMDLVAAKTGGSTGKALEIFCDGRCEELRHAAEIRSNGWANWDIGDKVAALWGNPPHPRTLKEKIRNALHDRLIYLDTVNLTDGSMTEFVRLWRVQRPAVLFGHSRSLYMFARFLQGKGVDDIRPKSIVSTSMMLLQPERELIEKAFLCKVTDRYGCEEVSLIACECEMHHGMHLNSEHLYVEFLTDDGRPVTDGQKGHIVVTDLINRGMPLIRYKVEDMGVPTARQCPCGRGLPLMEKVAGRVADYLVRRDGTLVAGVSLIERTLTAVSGIEQMQIVQDRLGEVVVNIVPMPHFDPSGADRLMTEFERVFGSDSEIRLRYVRRIPQQRSGKYRFAVCNLKNVN